MRSTYFFFLLVIVVSYAQGISDEGFATVTVPYSGMIPRCNSCTDQNTVPVSNMTCNSDPSWRNGIRTFADPIPQGYVAKSINVTFYCTFGCTDYVGADALVTIDGPIVNFIPKVYAASDCDCDGCMQEIHVSGVYPSGWPRYIYGGDNTIRITAANTSICVSHAIISIEYSLPTPEFTTFRPALIPVNTTENITIIGNDFLSSMKLKCSFGGFKLTNTTYVDSSQLTCPAPAIPVANSIEFQVIDEEGTAVLSGNFSWYYEPTVHSFYPTSGPSSGGVDVILEGAGFFNSSNMACKFGDAYVFSVEYINSSTVSCINVSGKKYVNATSVEVFFSENQQDFVQAETGQYQFTGPAAPTTTPSSAGSPTTDETGLPNYAWVGISLGIILLCILIAGITVVVLQNRKSKKNQFERSGNIQYDEESKLLRDPSFNVDSGDAIIPMDEIKNLRQIEKGSFGVIYEATWHGTKIAVKKLPAALTDKLKNEFFKEANLMKSLRHPNILQYLGVANTGREMCICMEFMSKGSLYRILHNPKSKFSRDKIKSICLDTVRGMNYLHAQNPPIVHRDLKTHNLLVDRHWQVKVCDFGLSRITAQNQTMTACGTPSWTAPEVLRNERYTTKADVYGFGVVVWEMFSRTDPFPGMPPFQIVFAVGTQKLRPKIESDWPLEWVNLITTCWSEDPNARPSFEELIPILEGMREAN